MRATIFQAAVAAIVVGLFAMFLIRPEAPPRPAPTTSWRPATELEQREQDRQRLTEEMDRLWEQRQR